MNTEERDDLWRLLGKAKQPVVSPFFARNIVREVRHRSQKSASVFTWLLRKWPLATIGATAAILITASSLYQRTDPDVMRLAQQVTSETDYEVINHLDELLASEESSLWIDNPSQ